MNNQKKIKIFCEASTSDKEGKLWEVVTITEGLTTNNAYYPAEVLKRDYSRLSGAPSYLYQLGETGVLDHLPEKIRSEYNGLLGNVIGFFQDPHIQTHKGKTAIVANLYIHEAAKPIRELFLDWWEHGKPIGFSANVLANFTKKMYNNKEVDWINKIWFISVDPVSHPAVADAQAINLLESDDSRQKGDVSMNTELKEAIVSFAQTIAPEAIDLVSDEIKNNPELLKKDTAIALIDKLTSSLSSNIFPEEFLSNHLKSLKEAIQSDDFDLSKNILDTVLESDKVGHRIAVLKKLEELLNEESLDKALQVVKQLSESINPNAVAAGIPKTDAERLIAHFGDDKAKELQKLLGDNALDCLPPRGQKVQQDDKMLSKLQSLIKLLENKDFEPAKNLLTAIIDIYTAPEFGSPYPKPSTVDAASTIKESVSHRIEDVLAKFALSNDDTVFIHDLFAGSDATIEEITDAIEDLSNPTEDEPDASDDTQEEDNQEQETDNPDEPVDDTAETNDDSQSADNAQEEEDSDSNEEEEEDSDNDTTAVRVTRMQLDNLLSSSSLPLVSKNKIIARFAHNDATKEELELAITEETNYLTELGIKPVDLQKDALEAQQKQVEQLLETQKLKLEAQQKESNEAFETERKKALQEFEDQQKKSNKILESEREKVLQESEQTSKLFKEQQRKTELAETQRVLEALLRTSGLTKISESRVRTAFEDKVADEDEIKKAIGDEANLTTQIISELASTVVDFGVTPKSEQFTESDAVKTVHSFFASRMHDSTEDSSE